MCALMTDLPTTAPVPARPAEHGWPQGDIPGEVKFCEAVPLEISRAVAAALVPRLPDLADANWRALCADQWPNGRYRANRGDSAWFVRVSELVGEPGREA